MNVLTRIRSGAAMLFKKHPLVANCTIYGSLYTGADLMQQFVSKHFIESDKDKEIDYKVARRLAVMGTFVYGPTLYAWYKWLDGNFPGTTRRVVVKKLLLDQCILTPICLTLFYTGMSIMEEREDVFEELVDKFVPTFIRSCCFWLPAQTVNFMFVAPRFRIVYMGLCGVVWINILCWMKRQNYHTITGAIITAQPLPEELPKESDSETESESKSGTESESKPKTESGSKPKAESESKPKKEAEIKPKTESESKPKSN